MTEQTKAQYIVYGKENCSRCVEVKNMFDNKNVPYEYITEFDRAEIMAKIPSDVRMMPLVFDENDNFVRYETLKEQYR